MEMLSKPLRNAYYQMLAVCTVAFTLVLIECFTNAIRLLARTITHTDSSFTQRADIKNSHC